MASSSGSGGFSSAIWSLTARSASRRPEPRVVEISNGETCLLDGESGLRHRLLAGLPGFDQIPDSGDRLIEGVEVQLSLEALTHFLELTIDLLCLSLCFLEVVPGAIGPLFQLSQLGGELVERYVRPIGLFRHRGNHRMAHRAGVTHGETATQVMSSVRDTEHLQ